MFDGTLTAQSLESANDPALSHALTGVAAKSQNWFVVFPFLANIMGFQKADRRKIEGTLIITLLSTARAKIYNDIRAEYNFAQRMFKTVDRSQLLRAFNEAIHLAQIELFDDEFYPIVSVDCYGEFTFYHKSKAGYVDIGVSGKKELSYHIRNDLDPRETKFDDHAWEDYQIPQKLLLALTTLKKQLKEQ